MAKRMEKKCSRRIGRFSRQRARPISAEFKYKEDVKYIMDNKSYLSKGIFIDHEYTSDIEHTIWLLLPIFRSARLNDTYKGYCKLEADKLVIRGRSYTLNNLNQLPYDLNCFKVTSSSGGSRIFPRGGANSQSGCANLLFWSKTA